MTDKPEQTELDGFILDAPPHGADVEDPEANQRWLDDYVRRSTARAAALRMLALEARQSPIYDAAVGAETHGPSKRVCYKAQFLRDTGAGRLDPRWHRRGRVVGEHGSFVVVEWCEVALVHPNAITFIDRGDADASNCGPLNGHQHTAQAEEQ